jgi:hypothetical protein
MGHARGLIPLVTESTHLAGVFWSQNRSTRYADQAADWRRAAAGAQGDEAFVLDLTAETHERHADAWRQARDQWAFAAGALWGWSALARTRLAPKLDAEIDADSRLILRLHPISRPGTILRSALLPGWGQSYAGRPRAAGWLQATGSILATATLLAHQASVRADINVLHADELVQHYQITDPQQTEAAFLELDHARELALQASRLRTVTIGLTAGLWAFNLLDAMVHTEVAPHGQANLSTQPPLALVSPGDRRLGLQWTY